MEKIYQKIKEIVLDFFDDEGTVYAAQASFFEVIAVFPFIMLILNAILLIPALSKDVITNYLTGVIPAQFSSFIFDVVNDLYVKSPGTWISITILTTLFAASSGFYALSMGLNRIWDTSKNKTYLKKRIINIFYTILIVLIIIASYFILVVGQTFINNILFVYFPKLKSIVLPIFDLRLFIVIVIFTFMFAVLYSTMPYKKLKLKDQWPGAIFTSLCWYIFSELFSLYFDFFPSSTYLYGSLTAVVLFMLWLWCCNCIFLFGAEINKHLHD